MADNDSTPINETIEEWRDVPGYKGFYQVSSFGRVRSIDRIIGGSHGSTRLRKGQLIAPFVSKEYFAVFLWRNAVGKPITVHRLVALAFLGPCPKGYQVNHISGDKTDNRPENLEYVTPRENLIHAIEHGLAPSWKGRSNPHATLRADDVRAIRRKHATGKYILRELAEQYGVTIQSVWAIIHRHTWKHI